MSLSIYKRVTFQLCLIFVFCISPVQAQQKEAMLHPLQSTSPPAFMPLEYQNDMDAFYLIREGEPLWFKNAKLTKGGRNLSEILKNAWKNGLNSKKYGTLEVQNILSGKRKHPRLKQDQALRVELLLTNGYIAYLRDLSGMRIRASDMTLRRSDWRQRVSAQDALSVLPQNIKTIDQFLKHQEPQTQTYQRLKEELTTLVEEKNKNVAQAEPLSFRYLLRPGRSDANVPKLRARFGLLMDIQTTPNTDGTPNKGQTDKTDHSQDVFIYDAELVNAIKTFQTKKGLKPDGVIGKQTLHALNQSREDKIMQIMVNMERLRWLADERPNRFIVVNIPSATLWAIENNEVHHEMPVIVGRKKRPTPSFVTYIHGVRFNPTWTVPPTIKEEDILPKLRLDASYLAGKGMELFQGYGKDSQTLDPMVIDWSTVTKQDLHGLRMVQVPGSHNPLGRVRILMPNAHNVYLHDTNHKSLFSRVDRAKSSGCVRMKYPQKIAMFALKNRKRWSEKRMRTTLKKMEMKDVYTSERIPVYLLYYTVWLGEQNQIVYGNDLYGNDKTLRQLIENLDGFPNLNNNHASMSQGVD